MIVAAALWWLYFDVVAIAAQRRLTRAAAGRERNELARDSYSYLHLPMVAGIALIAVGLKQTLAHVGHPLALVPAAALLGGSALYLLAHVAFRLRNMHTLNRRRLLCALTLLALVPLAAGCPRRRWRRSRYSPCCYATLIAYEALRFADARERIRHAPAQVGITRSTDGRSAAEVTAEPIAHPPS